MLVTEEKVCTFPRSQDFGGPVKEILAFTFKQNDGSSDQLGIPAESPKLVRHQKEAPPENRLAALSSLCAEAVFGITEMRTQQGLAHKRAAMEAHQEGEAGADA